MKLSARQNGLITEYVGDDLVVYDEQSHTAHSLGSEVASVWALCDGTRTAEQVVRDSGLAADRAQAALAELEQAGLMQEPPRGGVSRRQLLVRSAKVGGAAFAAPMIYSVTVGAPMAAASGCVADGSAVPGGSAHCGAAENNYTNVSTAYCCGGSCYNRNNVSWFCGTCSTSGSCMSSSNRNQCCSGQVGGFNFLCLLNGFTVCQ